MPHARGETVGVRRLAPTWKRVLRDPAPQMGAVRRSRGTLASAIAAYSGAFPLRGEERPFHAISVSRDISQPSPQQQAGLDQPQG